MADSSGGPLAQESLQPLTTIIQHVHREGWLQPYPEGLVHHEVGIDQIAADSVSPALHVRLTGEVTGEQQAGADLVLIQVAQQIDSLDAAFRPQGKGKAEPGRI